MEERSDDMGGKSKQEKANEKAQADLQAEQQQYLLGEGTRLRNQANFLVAQDKALQGLLAGTTDVYRFLGGDLGKQLADRQKNVLERGANINSTLYAQNEGLKSTAKNQANEQQRMLNLLSQQKAQLFSDVPGITGLLSNYREDSNRRRMITDNTTDKLVSNTNRLTRNTALDFQNLNQTLLSQIETARGMKMSSEASVKREIDDQASELVNKRLDANKRQRLLSSESNRRGYARTNTRQSLMRG